MNFIKPDLFLLENKLWMYVAAIQNPVYDFPFTNSFDCRRPWHRPETVSAVARVGAISDYETFYRDLFGEGVRLVNSPEQHRLASELPAWYKLLEDLTPKSIWFEEPPEPKQVEAVFQWPVFIKGARQTNRHDAKKSVAKNAVEFDELLANYRRDPILRWQSLVVREFVQLRPLKAENTNKIRPSYEFRTFWWKGHLVGAGPYWSQFVNYQWNETERAECLAVATEVASRLDCPFLVIDLAQTIEGKWIVIECNDAQESGYAGVSPFTLWNSILDLERT